MRKKRKKNSHMSVELRCLWLSIILVAKIIQYTGKHVKIIRLTTRAVAATDTYLSTVEPLRSRQEENSVDTAIMACRQSKICDCRDSVDDRVSTTALLTTRFETHAFNLTWDWIEFELKGVRWLNIQQMLSVRVGVQKWVYFSFKLGRFRKKWSVLSVMLFIMNSGYKPSYVYGQDVWMPWVIV